MTKKFGKRDTRVDILLVVISIVVLISSVWIWIVAMPIAKEIVFLATTIALVISLVLVVNVVILILLRFQKRISDLESALTQSETKTEATTEPAEDRVIVVTLTKIERRVINRLEENGGRMFQDELRRATGLSKSTLSVTLSTLERKSLVVREVTGRTKMVILKQKVTR